MASGAKAEVRDWIGSLSNEELDQLDYEVAAEIADRAIQLLDDRELVLEPITRPVRMPDLAVWE